MADDPFAPFMGESAPAPETPAPSAPAEAEAPAPSRVETPTLAPDHSELAPSNPTVPQPAPEPAAPPLPAALTQQEAECVTVAQQLTEKRGHVGQAYTKLQNEAQADYDATLRLQGRLSAEEWAQEQAAYNQRYYERQAKASNLYASDKELEAGLMQVGTVYQDVQRRKAYEPWAHRTALDILADQEAAKWKGEEFPRAEFKQRMLARQWPVNSMEAGAQEIAENQRRERALQRKLAGIDHMGGAGGGAGGGLDYAKMSTSELAKAGAESFFAKK